MAKFEITPTPKSNQELLRTTDNLLLPGAQPLDLYGTVEQISLELERAIGAEKLKLFKIEPLNVIGQPMCRITAGLVEKPAPPVNS